MLRWPTGDANPKRENWICDARISPRRGSDMSAQGNALGEPDKQKEPCPERAEHDVHSQRNRSSYSIPYRFRNDRNSS